MYTHTHTYTLTGFFQNSFFAELLELKSSKMKLTVIVDGVSKLFVSEIPIDLILIKDYSLVLHELLTL